MPTGELTPVHPELVATKRVNSTRQTYMSDTKIMDALLPGLELTPQLIFEEAELV